MATDNILKLWNHLEKSRVPERKAAPGSQRSAKQVDVWPGCLNGKPVDRLIIYLRSSGCHFALKTDGCSMCSHALIDTTLGEPISAEDYIAQFETAFDAHDGQRYPVVCIYNEGNILNDLELPFAALESIIKTLVAAGTKRLVIESRTEYVSKQKLDRLMPLIQGGLELEVGIGLESVHEFVRRSILRKEMTLHAFERAASVLRDYGVRSTAYVVVKPPFLTEAEAIRDAIDTTRYAFACGVDSVSLEPIGVEPYSIVDSLYQGGMYRPPWLWSVIEVARQCFDAGEIRIGGLQFAPIPESLPRNCDGCDARVAETMQQYNLNYDPAPMFALDHECKAEWQRETVGMDLPQQDDVLRDRVATAWHSLFGSTNPGSGMGKLIPVDVTISK